jgi:hypothetical protein
MPRLADATISARKTAVVDTPQRFGRHEAHSTWCACAGRAPVMHDE